MTEDDISETVRAFAQAAEDGGVRPRKTIAAQIRGADPPDRPAPESLRHPRLVLAEMELQSDYPVGIAEGALQQELVHLDFDAGLLLHLTAGAFRTRLPGLDLSPRELPEIGQVGVGKPLAHQDPDPPAGAPAKDHGHARRHRFPGLFNGADREHSARPGVLEKPKKIMNLRHLVSLATGACKPE